MPCIMKFTVNKEFVPVMYSHVYIYIATTCVYIYIYIYLFLKQSCEVHTSVLRLLTSAFLKYRVFSVHCFLLSSSSIVLLAIFCTLAEFLSLSGT